MINLRASTAPIGHPTKGPASNEHACLYQIQRVDDGRVRYRLRLGPFATENEAGTILAQVRLEYPGALLATAAADDLQAIALVRGKASPGSSPADIQATGVVLQSAADTRYIPPIPAVPAPPAAAPALPIAVAAPERAAVAVAADLASMQALIAAIDTDIEISPRTAAPRTAAPSTVAPRTAAVKPPVLHTVPAAKATARGEVVRGEVAGAGAPAPSLESTQTLRPLTPLELGEHEATRWFVVQLALSDDAFDPDSLPHLDIFSLYRLYTVIGLDQGRLVHALRLGFFAEEVGARAVAGYLAGFYDKSVVKRVSVAERDRFADQRVEARKDVGATGRHLAIEITNELVVRGRRSSR